MSTNLEYLLEAVGYALGILLHVRLKFAKHRATPEGRADPRWATYWRTHRPDFRAGLYSSIPLGIVLILRDDVLRMFGFEFSVPWPHGRPVAIVLLTFLAGYIADSSARNLWPAIENLVVNRIGGFLRKHGGAPPAGKLPK